MIKFREIGMFATAKNDPTIKAHATIKNGYLCSIASGRTVALANATAAKVAELKLALLHHDADEFMPSTIAKDAYVTAFDVPAWAGQHLIVTRRSLEPCCWHCQLCRTYCGQYFRCVCRCRW